MAFTESTSQAWLPLLKNVLSYATVGGTSAGGAAYALAKFLKLGKSIQRRAAAYASLAGASGGVSVGVIKSPVPAVKDTEEKKQRPENYPDALIEHLENYMQNNIDKDIKAMANEQKTKTQVKTAAYRVLEKLAQNGMQGSFLEKIAACQRKARAQAIVKKHLSK